LAVNPAEPSVILGYVAYEERGGKVVLHYLYVKHQLRRMGLGRYLAEQVRANHCRYTHHTRAGARLVEVLGARYAPEFIEGEALTSPGET
jgi:GNAT superfamily N-acetyltransferase